MIAVLGWRKMARACQPVRQKISSTSVWWHQRALAPSVARRLSASSVHGLAVDGIRSDNPTRWIDNPSLPATLPKSLGEAEIVQLLDAAARLTPAFSAIRAVTMLEVLYATGLRVSELMGLEVSAFRRQPDTILITGKGGRERMVPLGDTAKAAVARWLECRDSHPVFML